MAIMAVENAKFIVYKSAAGSGKTFTLVREYLKIVLQNPEHFRQVLAITFTNKAANEMKERIIRNLVLLADPDNNREQDAIRYLLPQLVTQIKLSEAQIKSRAAQVLRLIIHHYAEFAISTIDSFTHRVIRTFAHDLKIPMNFEVELDAEAMLSQAVDLLISQVGIDEKLTRIMVDFVEKKAEDETNWRIENDLNEFGKTLLAESSIPAISEIRNYEPETFLQVMRKLAGWKYTWEGALKKLSAKVIELINREHLSSDAFIQKERGILGYVRKLSQGNYEKIKPGSYAQKALDSGEWINPKADPGQKAAFDRIASDVLNASEQLHDILEKDLSRYILCQLLMNHLFSTALLSEIEKALNSLCSENNKLLISEFNRRISRIVQEQPAPFIYERLGEKYHHYLIDEFQDTSILQWHNLLPLIENSLASSRMNLVVGDAKQAIYRWRSGDAEQFEILPRLIREENDPLLELRERALVNHYTKEELTQNHRSSPVIVDFNNSLFTFISGLLPDPYGESFKHATQDAARKDKPGMVKLEKVEKGEDEEKKYEELVHEKIFSIIEELQEDHFELKDAAILCRENKKASKIAAFLLKKGIPVISSESLLLTQSEQVNFLVAWMQYLVDPADGIPRAHILRYLIDKGFAGSILMEDFFGTGNQEEDEAFRTLLAANFSFIDYNRLKGLELFGLVQYLTFHFNLNRLNDSYLRFFMDAILDFVKDHKGGLPEFLEWWEDKRRKTSVIIPEGINAVRIMTIHKAKGLQFPVVIFPFADDSIRPTQKNLWVKVDDELLSPLKTVCLPAKKSLSETIYSEVFEDELNRSFVDMVNVLYVALTRPEERLYVLVKNFPEKTDGPPSVPKLLSLFFMTSGIWQSGRDNYLYGERWKKSIKEIAATEEEVSPGETAFCRSSLKLLLRRHAPQAWDMEDPEKNREWGNLVHLVMSLLEQPGQLETVLQEMLVGGIISSKQKNDLLAVINQILTNQEISGFFSSNFEVRNEPEILTAEGILYRPDRVLMRNDHVTIIDYKTGKKREENRGQIIKYADLMKDMGYKVEAAYLVYLNQDPETIKVL